MDKVTLTVVIHDEVLCLAPTVDGSDDTPVIETLACIHDVDDFIVSIEVDIVCAGSGSDIGPTLVSFDRDTNSRTCAEVAFAPVVLITDLDLVAVSEGEILANKPTAFFFHREIRGFTPRVDGSYDSPASGLDKDSTGLRIVSYDIDSVLRDGNVISLGNSRERNTDSLHDATHIFIPTVVLAEFETSSSDIGGRADPFAFSQDHINVSRPGVEVSDEAPYSSVRDGDCESVKIKDNLVESRIKSNIVASGYSLKRLTECLHGSTVVLGPVSILTEFESTCLGNGDISGPDVAVLSHSGVSRPRVEVTDNTPSLICGFGFRLYFFAAFLLAVHVSVDFSGNVVKVIEVEVNPVLTSFDGDIGSTICKVIKFTSPVHSPVRVSTELELGCCRNINIGIETLLGSMPCHDNIIAPVTVETDHSDLIEREVFGQHEA